MYPDYPKNRLIVNGIDLTEEFKMVLVDGYTLGPPTPKTYSVDIPGGNGSVDLTEALSGDVVYSNRKQEFSFYIIDVDDFERAKTDVSALLHGRAFDYQITMDPDYIYHGRFTISSYEHEMYTIGKVGIIKISIDADPYKIRPTIKRVINCYGGNLFHLRSGRLSVRPKIGVSEKTKVIFNDHTATLSEAGNWSIADLIFKYGINELYMCSHDVRSITWGYFEENELTFKDLKQKRIFEWYREEYTGNDVSEVTIEYDWKDL